MPDDDIRELTLRVRVDGNQLKVLGADFGKTGDAAKGAGKEAESAGQRAKKFFKQLPQAAKAAVGVFLLYKAFAAVKRILSNSVAEAVKYQKNLSLIVGLVGVSREQVALWGDDLKSLGPRVGKGLGELSDALFFITSAGYRGAEALDVLEASAKAATAGLGETKNIADLVTSAVNVYGRETLSASDATDILVAGVREGKAEAAEFSTSLGRVIGDANELGVSFDEVTATVASLTRTGINAAESTTQLRAILKGLTRPSKEASDILGEVNLSFADIRRTIQEKGFLAGLQQLGDVADELGQEKFARLFESTEAYSAIVKLTGESAASTGATFTALADATGSTDAAFAEAKKNASFWYDVLKSKLGVVMVDFGTVILPLATSGVKGLITFISLLSDGVKALANAFSNAFSGIKESIQGSLGFLDKLITSLPRNASEGALTDISLRVPEGVGGGVDLAAVVAGLRTQAEAEKEVITAVKEKVKAAKEAISANEELNKSLQSQIKTLQQTAKTSGLTGKEIIEYEKRIEIAKGATEEMAEETAALKRELLGLKEGLEAVKQLDKLDLDILPDSAKLAKARDEILGHLDKVAAAIPERAEEWERKRLAVTAKYAKDITQAQSKELVKRLKNSDSFYDQLRGHLLEFRQEAAENGQLMSSFFADTLSQMRNAFSDLFYNAITGKFKDLTDVARNTWSAILRSFTQLLAQMATQRLVLNIVPNLAGVVAAGGAQGAGQLLSSGAGIGGTGGLISRIPGFGAGQTFGGPAIPFGGVGPVQQTPFLASGAANFAGGALGAYNILSSLFKGDIAGGVGAGIGGGIGAAAGSFLPGIGTLVGFGIGSTIGKFLGGFFRKKPRLDIDIEPSEKAAVEDLLKDTFESSISISSRKTGVDKGPLRAAVAAALEGQIKQVQAIIDTLPEDVADSLNEALLSTTIDREEHFGRDRLLEFDKKGKNIRKHLEQFLGGELQARFLFSVRDFFSGAFESLGVLPERARELVDAEFERFKSAGSREDRAAIGQEFLSTFAAAADVYNLVNTNVLSPLELQLRAVEDAAKKFGFEGIPSLEMIDEKLKELLRDFNDPQALRALAEFRQNFVVWQNEIADAANLVNTLLNTEGLSPLELQLRAVEDAAKKFGFEGIPSLEMIDEKLKELLRDFNDPQALRALAEFRQNFVVWQNEIADAANLVNTLLNTEGLSPLELQLRAVEDAAKKFGFEGIPSLEMIDEKLKELLRDFNDPQALRALAEFRQNFVVWQNEIADAANLVNTLLNTEGLSPLELQLRAVEDAAKKFGFEGIPSLEMIDEKLKELLRDFNDPQALRALAEFRQNFVVWQNEIADAANLVNTLLNTEGLSPLELQLRAVEDAAKKFGFEGIPSLEMIDEKLKELLRDFNDPQALRALAEFRQGLMALPAEIAAAFNDAFNSVNNGLAQIRTRSRQIYELGRFIGRDFSAELRGDLQANIESIDGLLSGDTLSIEQRSSALEEQHSAVQELISLEKERFEASKRAQLATLDIQLEALRKLQTDFTGVFAAAGNALLRLRTGDDSILSPAERLQAVRDEISGLQGRITTAQGADLVDIQQRLTQLFPEAVRIAREGFGEGSSAAFAQFAAAEEGLKLVQDQTRQEIITQQGLVAQQNEIAARIEAVNNRQFTVSLETKRIIDVHLSNQNSLLEESQTQQSRMVSELERIGGSLRRIENSLERSLRQPLQGVQS